MLISLPLYHLTSGWLIVLRDFENSNKTNCSNNDMATNGTNNYTSNQNQNQSTPKVSYYKNRSASVPSEFTFDNNLWAILVVFIFSLLI